MSGRQFVLWLLALAGVFAWERAESHRERGQRSSAGQLGPLVPDAWQERVTSLGAVTLSFGSGTWTYVRDDQGWRCPEVFHAPAQGSQIETLWKQALEAQGQVHSDDPTTLNAYGLGDDRVTVGFFGPRFLEKRDRDLYFSIEVGASIRGRSGCYARRPEDARVWAIDQDLRAPLTAPDHEGAPLLDPAVVPESWSRGTGRLHQVRVLREEAPPLDLTMSFVNRTPDELRQGAAPFRWEARQGGKEVAMDDTRAHAYTDWLLRLRWQRVVGLREEVATAHDRHGRVVLVPTDGEPLALEVRQDPDRTELWVGHDVAGLWYAVAVADPDLLLPAATDLDGPPDTHPWRSSPP